MKPLTIVVAPVNAVGHVNACSGALAPLVRRGHRVIFVIEEAFAGKLAALGFEEFTYQVQKGADSQNPGETISTMLLDMKILGDYSPWEKMENMVSAFHCEQIYAEITTMDRKLREAIDKFKPDLFYFDGGLLYPSIYHSGIPWIKNVSVQPLLFLVDETNEIPPGASGMTLNLFIKFI